MANQTVSVNRNLDDAAINGLLNGDDIAINTGAVLTINSDSRYGQQAAVIGAITIDAATGGRCLIDGRDVWEVTFSAATGNVPALGTAGTYDSTGQNTFSQGEFLGVWANRWEAPLTAGGAMPSSGIIKFRRKSAAFDGLGEVINLPGGATVTTTDGGKAGWLSIVGEGLTSITVPRVGSFRAYGAWFDLGTTNGADDQYVSFYSLDICPAIEIETAPGSGVYEQWLNAGYVRWGQAANRVGQDSRGKMFGQGQRVTGLTVATGNAVISGFTDTSHITIGSRAIHANLGTNPYVIAKDATTVTLSVNNATAGSALTINFINEKLYIGRRATNACGYKPAAGCKIRVPNVHISSALSTVGSWVRDVFPSSTIADRWEFVTTSAGDIEMSIISGNWYINLSQPYRAVLTSVFTADQILISECATKPVLTNCAVGLSGSLDAAPVSFGSCFQGVDIIGGAYLKYEAETGDLGASISDVIGLNINGAKFITFGDNTAATLDRGASGTACLTITRCSNFTITSPVLIGSSMRVVTCSDGDIYNPIYCDQIEGRSTVTTNGVSGVDINTGSQRVHVHGWGGNLDALANVHPYTALVSITQSYFCLVEDIATPASPFDCGSANAVGSLVLFNGSGSNNIARNLYGINLRTSVVADNNSESNNTYTNCWGDGADALTLNCLGLKAKGLRSTNPTTGATSVYGSHFYDTFVSTTEPRLIFMANEPTAASAEKCFVSSGVGTFTSTGTVKLVNVGDEVTWVMDYFLRGWLSFANAAPTFSGTNSANHVLEYQIERMVNGLPTGWNGTWLTANAANLSAETIPPYVSESNPGGVRLKFRVRCTVAAATNAVINVRITGVTDAATYVTAHPKAYPSVKYTGVEAGSILGVFDPSGGLVGFAETLSNVVEAKPAWNSDYNGTLRLRRAGWQPAEAVVSVIEAGLSLPAAQTDWSDVANTDPGALGITLTNHGASPVTWNGKDFSITITTTDDGLTAAQVAAYISWNIAKAAFIGGHQGLAWPTMVIPGFETSRGTLLGSAGASLKGVRVVRSNGTTPVPGFTRMQADDGSYWVAPTISNITAANLEAGTRVFLRNLTTGSTKYNAVLGGVGFNYSYTEGTDFTAGDEYILIATKLGKENIISQGVVGPTGTIVSASQVTQAVYALNGIDGATVTGIVFNTTSIDIDFTAGGNLGWRHIFAAYCYAVTTEDGINNFVGLVNAIDESNYVFNAAIVFNNLQPATVKIGGDGIGTRADGGSLFGTGNLQIDNATVAFTAGDIRTKVDEIHTIKGLNASRPMTATPTAITAGDITLALTGDGVTTKTATRQ